MSSALTHFVTWLAQTPVSLTIQRVGWIIPTVQTIHILGIAGVVGSMGLLDLRVLGLAARRQSVKSVATQLTPWVWRALAVLLLSGAIMITGEPARSLPNLIFQVKMALVVLAGTLTVLLTRALKRTAFDNEQVPAPAVAKILAGLSLAIWIAIVFAGRWIAYGDTLFGAGS